MFIFTQTSFKFAPGGPTENKPSIITPEMRQEGFLLITEICQPSTGVKT